MLKSSIPLLAFSLAVSCSEWPPPVTSHLPSLSGQTLLCENDARCSAGTYCQAGVCDADCTSASDCAGGSCDDRGRCSGPAASSETSSAASSFSGSLSVAQTSLKLAAGQLSSSLSLSNAGQTPISHYHVLSDDPGVTVTPARGTIAPGQTVPIAVNVRPGWSGTATLRTLSSGGVATTVVTAESGLVGYLQGTVSVETPFALGSADLAMDVTPGFTGVVDEANSLLWPKAAAVTVSDDGGFTTLQFTLVSEPGDNGNPNFDSAVQRVVTLSGQHQNGQPLRGAYQEVISGLGPGTVNVGGTFELSRSGASHGLVAEGMPTFTPPGAPPKWPSSACLSGDSNCPGTVSQRASYYFGLAFPFEQWSWESSITDGMCLLTSGGAPVPCVQLQDELPAAEAFAAGASSTQVWEVFRAVASEAQLQGKDILANTLQPANAVYQGAAIDSQQFAKAAALIEQGLHQRSGVGGLLAVDNLSRSQGQVPAPSVLDKAASDAQRFGGVVSAALFAAGQEVDRQRRSGVPGGESMVAAQNSATSAFLDAAALATLDLDGTVATTMDGGAQLVDCAPNFANVASAFDQLRLGLNAVGYPQNYIPFVYNASDPNEDVFQQLYAHVTQNDLPAALSAEQALEADDRSFEQSQTTLTAALAAVSTQLQSEVTSLCGGQGSCTGGQLATDQADMQAAVVAMGEAAVSSSNAAQKLTLLQQQLQQESGQQVVEIDAMTADGQSEAAVAIADAREQKQNLDWQCAADTANAANSFLGGIGQAIGGFFSGGWGGLISGIGTAAQSIGNSTSSAVQACEEDDNFSHHVDDAGQDALAESDAQIQVQKLENLVSDNNLIDEIFDAQSDSESALAEAQRQDDLMNAATSQFQTDVATLNQDIANAHTLQNVQTQDADPTLRLYQDQTGMQWASEMQGLRSQAFLATRAFEYMTNQSYAQEMQVFSAATGAELQGYLVALDDAYQGYQMTAGWGQDRYDVLSLRQDILGMTQPLRDPVSGQEFSPEAQFQAFLALPKNRDANGNLALQFNTNSATGGLSLFSPDICEDRIVDVKINVVSSSLSGSTGYVGLAEGGDTRLVDCLDPATASDYVLPAKNALISAGLNLPRSAASDPTVPANTDLFERPTMASSWILSIDLADPRNAWINLNQIDDLEIWVHHTAETIQGG